MSPRDQLQELEKSCQKLPTPQPTTSYFAKFPDLPTEIRLLIWNMASDEQRIVALRSSKNVGGFRSATPQPAILYVCQESRQIALLKYELAFSGSFGDTRLHSCKTFTPKTYFNFERDIVYIRNMCKLEDPGDSEMTVARFGLHIDWEQFNRVKSIGIDVKSSRSASTSLSWLDYKNPRDLRTIYLCTEYGDLKAAEGFCFDPLEEKDYDHFIADTRNDVQKWFWPQPGSDMKLQDEMENIRSHGFDKFPKLEASLQLGDTPNFCLVKVTKGETSSYA